MSGTAERTVTDATTDLVLLACAGIQDRDLRESTAKRARELTAEACLLDRAETEARYRRSLSQSWSAWLDLAMSGSLPSAGGRSLLQDVLDLEPELRERFEEAFLGERRG